jgi:selenide,water dikinase
MHETLPKKDLVLIGIGHTHAHIVRMWKMNPIPDVRLTCVTNFWKATYSGMLPGTLAGLYPRERMEIDLVRLASASGARLIQAKVTGLDRQRQTVLVEGRPPIPYDALSIGIGSRPVDPPTGGNDRAVVLIKPMQTFLDRLDERVAELFESDGRDSIGVAVVGAGAGGLEVTFAMPAYFERRHSRCRLRQILIDRHTAIGRGLDAPTVRRVRRELERRGVEVMLGRDVVRMDGRRVYFSDGGDVECDLVLWAASARAPDALHGLGLPTDEAGFLLTDSTLRTIAGDAIFAVGDTGTIEAARTPKAGVYAVRQGPILWENLRRQLSGESLISFQPQKGFLKLLSTGDRRAILSWKGLSFHARWCWKLKDYIDGRFMDMYQSFDGMADGAMASAPLPPTRRMKVRCTGCGGKVGGSVLSRVLDRLDIPPSEHVLVGLDQPDDAAVIRPPGGRPVVATADFFSSFLDDPYLVGRVAALNSASDLFALGSKPVAALALATIPVGDPRKQEDLLFELLSGSLREFRAMGATLVGGHTIEGPSITLGFAMLGGSDESPPTLKSQLVTGDLLVLTKPLGTGILLAAHMQARLKAEWMDGLQSVLLTSNQRPAELAREMGVRGMTDVTGFGLAGHLLEMLSASGLSAELWLETLPLLPGTEELIRDGVESTLAPANRAALAEMDVPMELQRLPTYAALFDPQTSGGLLVAVAADRADDYVSRFAAAGLPPARVVGQVGRGGRGPRLKLAARRVHRADEAVAGGARS